MRFLQTNDEENLMKFIMARINEAYRENPNNEKYALGPLGWGSSVI